MRIVFIGAGRLTLATAATLLKNNHEVIIIEQSKEKIDNLSDKIDCGFLHGDGSTPAVLREAGPEHTDFLFCLTGSDQTNIIASLVGRSLGYAKVITKIEDAELDHICKELGLGNTIIPTQTISRYLTDLVAGRDIHELSSMIKGEARFFSFIIGEEDEGEVRELSFPATVRVICYYRDGDFRVAEETSKLKKGDEVVILIHSKDLEAVKKRWSTAPEHVEKAAAGESEADVAGTENIK